jgi:Protein of unknown function (DUF3800)
MDESGNLGKQDPYFIMAAIATTNPENVRKIITERFGVPFKQYLIDSRVHSKEIKASNSDDTTRNYILSELSKADCDIYVKFVPKDKMFIRPRQGHREQNKLYNLLFSRFLRMVLKKEEKAYVIIDEKYTHLPLKENFDGCVRKNLFKEGYKPKFYQVPSHSDNGLIVVDFVAWAAWRKFNGKNDLYFDLIKNKVKNIDDMEHWSKVQRDRKLGNNLKGLLIEESLENKSVLNKIRIIKSKVVDVTEKDETPWLSKMTLDVIEVPEKDAAKIAEEILNSQDKKHNWPSGKPLAHFSSKTAHFTVRKDRVIKSVRAKFQRGLSMEYH